jgi:hypothetical protein
MTAPASSTTITTSGPNPVSVTLPGTVNIDKPGFALISHGRLFQRSAQGQYVENKDVFVDATGTAESADVADAKAALADATTDLADAHTVITTLIANAKAIPKDIEKDADSMVARLEKWVRRVL